MLTWTSSDHLVLIVPIPREVGRSIDIDSSRNLSTASGYAVVPLLNGLWRRSN